VPFAKIAGVSEDERIRARVRALVAAALSVDEDTLTRDTSLRDDIGADSLAVMELLTALEDDLAIEVPGATDFAVGVRTVGDLEDAFATRAS
jgi:acyl carrier protein